MSRQSDYTFAQYHPSHEAQVVRLLQTLWGLETDLAAKVFRWKYYENPDYRSTLGIVALHEDEVVGFRGYVAERFELRKCGTEIGVLFSGDACVDANHRRKGLSVGMGELAMSSYARDFQLVVSMTCNEISLPAAIRLGFQPLAPEAFLTRYSSNPLVWLAKRVPGAVAFLPGLARPSLGQFGDIYVTDRPLPQQMAAIIRSEPNELGLLRPKQSEEYFEWRYRNPARKYVFYHLIRGGEPLAYAVLNPSENGITAEILDYGERRTGAVLEILDFILSAKHYRELSIHEFGASKPFQKELAGAGFAKVHPMKRAFGGLAAVQPSIPVLLRPVSPCLTDEGYSVCSVDTRNIDNWLLKPICSDAA